jgi:type IV pilus assembly protein PilW
MTRALHPEQGLTLVELMIGVVIGLFLVAAMGGIYVSSQGTFRAQGELARMQQNGRFAIDTMAQDLRVAGSQGCQGFPASQAAAEEAAATATVPINLLGGLTLLNNHGLPAWGSRSSGGNWSPALDATLATALSPAPDITGDVLLIRRSVGPGWALIADNDGVADLQVSAAVTPIAPKDILMISDCSGAIVFEAGPATSAAAGSIAHPPFPRKYKQEAVVQRVQALVYYLAPSANPNRPGAMALWSFAAPAYGAGPGPVELITGVQGLNVRFGLDTSAPADGTADQYLDASGVAALPNGWSRIASVRIELLLVSTGSQVTTAPQPYQFNGQTVTPTDRRLRTVMSTTVSMRNYLP